MYIPLFFAGIVGIYAKASLMEEYWLSIARLLDKETVPFQVGLAYFSLDLLVNFLLLPCLVIAFSFFLSKKMALMTTTLTSCLLITFYFIQFRVQDEVGQYASSTLLYEAFLFAMSNPALTTDYVNENALIKLLSILFVTIFCSVIISIANRREWLTRLVGLAQGVLISLGLVSLLVALSFYPEKSSGLYQSVAHKIVRITVSEVFSPINETASLDKRLLAYRNLTKTPHDISNNAIFASESASNVLYFVLETGPADVLHDGISELISKELIQNSLIAEKHHTTYPYTSDSIFSLLSGLYPEGRRRSIDKGGFQHRGVFAQLRDKGYETGAYTPDIYNAEVDEKMLKQFGFSTLFVSKRNTAKTALSSLAKETASDMSSRVFRDSPHFEQGRLHEFETTLFYDLHALEKMKSDMRSAIRAGKKFAHLYLPQIGHGPWFKIGHVSKQKEYGRALMKLQSLWLRDIVLMLKNEGELHNTIIVLTADHGVRTKAEDASFEVGTINSYSFHVPLMLYSPSGFRETITIKKLTSHIDIESSIAFLLGLQSGLGITEGIPLWEPSPKRRVYFFSTDYGGAEGFYDGQFFMNNVITEIQHKSTLMKFSATDSILFKQEEKDFVLNGLDEFRSQHRSIMSAL